jgi:GNAT superfamily N-acetyltransferase
MTQPATRYPARRVRPRDVPALLALLEAYWQFEALPNFDAARLGSLLRRLLAEPEMAAAWITADSDGPVGYLVAVYVFSLEKGGLTAEIDEFFVLPRGRRHGAGTELLRAAEAEFLSRGCTSVALQLARSNDSAREFYLRRGYSARTGYELLNKDL